MRKKISLEEALELLLNHSLQMEEEQVHLMDALGRVLSKDVVAQENTPPFDRSPYDGYAFRSEDTKKATKETPALLEVIEEVPAGYAPKNKAVSGTAIKILTGAPIPEGADAVIMYEATSRRDNLVAIYTPAKPGENVIRCGEDVRKGAIIALQGALITPPLLGLLAAQGISAISVYRRPRIGVVNTGDELLDVAESLAPGKIRNSNSYTLMGYIQLIGAEPVILGTAQDRTEAVASLIEKGLEKADMVITTGGVSVGDYDVVGKSVELIGAETLYWKLDLKPGSPTLAAAKDGKLILGLSGNPAAAMIIFQLLGFPYIRKMAGRGDYLNQKLEVVLKKDFPKSSPKRRFLRGRLSYDGGATFMDSTGGQGNGVLSSLIGSNLLVEIPAGSGPVQSGTKLTAYLIH